jgi:hypothetical protein
VVPYLSISSAFRTRYRRLQNAHSIAHHGECSVSLVEPSLVEKVVALHRALANAQIGHAFGGALALAYYTNEPRATADIDLNIELDSTSAAELLQALPPDVSWTNANLDAISVDDQVRLWWGRTPVDLFFRASEFHDEVAQRCVWHKFADTRLPFLSALDLTIFKALFDRPKDWLDIKQMIDAKSVRPFDATNRLRQLLGDDERVHRLVRLDQD